jgi:hypothetical protein
MSTDYLAIWNFRSPFRTLRAMLLQRVWNNCDGASLLESDVIPVKLLASTFNITVIYLLKPGTVEPEKQPLLANGSETTFISRQRPQNRQRKDVRC